MILTQSSGIKKSRSLKSIIFLTAISLILAAMFILSLFGKALNVKHRVGYLFLLSSTLNVMVVTKLIRLVGRQQRKLGASEDRYRALFEHASDGIGVITGADYRLVEVNHKFGEILGFQPEELIGRDVRELVQVNADNRASNALSEFIDGTMPEAQTKIIKCPIKGVMAELFSRHSDFAVNFETYPSERELKIQTSKGSTVPVSVSFSRLSTHQERLIILIIRDLSESKRLEAEKEEMQRQLFQSSKLASIGELSAGVAHEINNPLNCIINFAQLLKDETTARTETERRSIDGIIEEGERITRIVRDLLTFARMDSYELACVQIADAINTSASLFGHQLEKDGITVEIDVEENLPSVRADGSRLRQVMVNMISNAHHALKAKSADDKLFRITARAVEREGNPAVRIEFFDNGVGIRQENIDKIFDPFFTTRRDSGGTGLGLSLSFGIVRDYGGTIIVESEEGRYTYFTVELPTIDVREHEYAESFAGGR
jgi:signal transduction histidine kinase